MIKSATKVSTVVLALTFSLWSSYATAMELEPTSCESCQSQEQFEAHAVDRVSGFNSGEFFAPVVNISNGIIFYVTVSKEIDMGHVDTTWYSERASAAEELDLVSLREVFEKAEYETILQSGEGRDTFNSHSREQVGNSIISSDWIGLAVNRPTLFNVVKWRFGYAPVAVVVFSNGDVAKFTAIPGMTGASCCNYIPGTARNANGDPISDEGFGGTAGGGGEGGNYVERPQPTEIRIRIGYRYLSCSYQGNRLQGCSWV